MCPTPVAQTSDEAQRRLLAADIPRGERPDIDAGAVAHLAAGLDAEIRVLGVEEVVEIERGLVGGLHAGEAELVGNQAAVSTAGHVIGVVVGPGEGELALPSGGPLP